MNKEIWHDYFENLSEAITRLAEVLQKPNIEQDQLLQDAAIQRFEFCIELYWKVLKKFLAYEKIMTNTPREVLQQAYQSKLINDEKLWLTMMDDRNKNSHVYKEEVAQQVFLNLRQYLPVMQQTYHALKQRFDKMN